VIIIVQAIPIARPAMLMIEYIFCRMILRKVTLKKFLNINEAA
jgi:hypothetical protein